MTVCMCLLVGTVYHVAQSLASMGATEEQQALLFSGTATKVYRL
jgi:hypothetical protein